MDIVANPNLITFQLLSIQSIVIMSVISMIVLGIIFKLIIKYSKGALKEESFNSPLDYDWLREQSSTSSWHTKFAKNQRRLARRASRRQTQ